MKLGVIIPSRGTMFSRTMDTVFQNLKSLPIDIKYDIYMAHGRPIPNCFNEPLEKALSEGCDWIWFVEEDMLLPPNILRAFYATTESVVTIDYADRRTGIPLILRDAVDEVIFSGMGCMLVAREVFDKMSKPYLQQMVFWQSENNGDIKWIPHPEIKTTGYGQQDLYLCWMIRKLGYRIHEVKGFEIGHMSLLSKAEDITNNGGDTIKIVYINDSTSPTKN